MVGIKAGKQRYPGHLLPARKRQPKQQAAESWCEALSTDRKTWDEWKFRVVKNKSEVCVLK